MKQFKVIHESTYDVLEEKINEAAIEGYHMSKFQTTAFSDDQMQFTVILSKEVEKNALPR